ncbi:DUF3443 family protein, partial [Kitasatospora sp. NPDC093558]|uniref:DUF3443 family protein n=1 Tax=Kitasatospora sp. NPDC093558 TaxID=3155201 RepID=UPI0034363B32
AGCGSAGGAEPAPTSQASAESATSAASAASTASNQPGPVTIPLTYLPAGSASGQPAQPRLATTISVGTSRLNVLVDTGSSGLKVLASKVAATDATTTGTTSTGAFGNGLTISGNEATATLTLGAATATAQTIVLVNSVSCAPTVPNCEAANGQTPEEFGGVFDGILGIGMTLRIGTSCCTNPMVGLTGNTSYVIHFDPAAPTLVLRPAQATTARFTMTSLPPTASASASPSSVAAWDATPMQACLTVSSVLGKTCAPVVLDTGSATLNLLLPPSQAPPSSALTGGGGVLNSFGQQVQLTIPPALTWTYTMPPAATPAAAQTQLLNALSTPLIAYASQPNPLIVAGLPIFTRTDVLYDLGNGRICLAPQATQS